MILTDGPKMVLTPTYHVYRMYVPFQDATLVPVSFEAGTYHNGDVSVPRVDAIAARDAAGHLWLALTNVDPNESTTMVVNVPGVSARSATGEVLTAPAVDSHNTFDRPNTVRPAPYRGSISNGRLHFELPAKSIAVIRVD
jgi:alpha-N-arabinofuranosidase